MNRRVFLWQGLCSSLPFFARFASSQQASPGGPRQLNEADIASFARGLTGSIFRPGEARYEQQREVYAAKYAAHPALIVRPAMPKDVQASLSFAKSNGLPIAVRCGGHSYAGYSVCEGGLVIDMSGLRDISIAPDQHSARLGGGMLCGRVEIETARVGTATVLGQCPSVGVGGFLLGGGISPLMSKYGLGCDNIVAADLVLADGKQIRASARENPDLYWAIRGGGGNFGVVTSFEVALHPVSTVYAGILSLQSDDARELLLAFRDAAPAVPDGLTLIAVVSAAPDRKPRIDIQVCHVGDLSQAEKALAPLRHHRALLHDGVRTMPYLQLEQMTPASIPPSYEEHYGGFFADFDDRRVETLAHAFTNPLLPVNCFLIHLHGAVTRIPASATPFPLRREGIAIDAAAYWKPPAGRSAAIQWVEDLRVKMPADRDGNYVNVMDRVGEREVRRAYGVNYTRLQHLKAQYDPGNLFSLNQNISPA
jgi:FAD binding domain/Berberine and berberine like